ncbi:MAG TPA: acyltransferase family protein, partial [Gemmatimonadales bacterium]|nr:acyltransferase family protein [Gemmatimonadales bacterium]
MTDQRLHGLDAVRGLALSAGVVLHAAMAFLPGPQVWLVADTARSTTLSVTFFAIHMARMTVFFVLAGFFGRMLLHRSGTAAFVRKRLKRIAVPLVLAWPPVFASIVAVMSATAPEGAPSGPGLTLRAFPLTHLWFLYLLLLLYAGMLPLRAVIVTADRSGRFRGLLDAVLSGVIRPWGALFLALPVALALYLQPWWFQWFGIPTPDTGFIPNRAAVVAYGLAFVTGWLLHRQDALLLPRLRQQWGVHLAIALAATIWCLATTSTVPLLAPVPFGTSKLVFALGYAIGTWSWTLALLGIGLRFMDGHSPARRYLADASYWIYLAHLPLVIGLQFLMKDWPLPWQIKFPLLLGVAVALLLGSYHWLVRPTAIGALLNGRRHRRARPVPSPEGTTLMKKLPLLLL